MHNLLLSLSFLSDYFFVFNFCIFVLPLGEVDYYVTVSVKCSIASITSTVLY